MHPAATASRRLVFLLVFVVGSVRSATADETRLPVPDASAREAALATIQELYRDKYEAAQTDAAKSQLAAELLTTAKESGDEPAAQFALLRVAKDLAAGAGDLETATGAIDLLADRFEIDSLTFHAKAVIDVSAKAKLPVQHAVLANRYFELIEQATKVDRFDVVSGLKDAASDSARKARSPHRELVFAAIERAELCQQHFEALEPHLPTLKSKPTDPAANLAAGKYRCLIKRNWEQGIPMLALGNDPALAKLAATELGGVTTPAQMLALADAWSAAADPFEGRERRSLILRAGHWYRQAFPKLDGFESSRVRKFLREETIPVTIASNVWGLPKMGWQQGKSPVKLIAADAGFAYINFVSGYFGEIEEAVAVAVGDDGHWYVAGNNKRKQLEVGATCAELPNEFMDVIQITRFDWKLGEKPVRMIHRSEGLCFLTGIAGKFRSGSEVGIGMAPDGYWYLSGASDDGMVSAQAIAVTIPGFGEQSYSVEEFAHRAKDRGKAVIHRNDGFCFLTSVGGDFQGTGEAVFVFFEPNSKRFSVQGRSYFDSTRLRACSVRYEPKPTVADGIQRYLTQS